jgi:hypothetical protein
MSLFYSVQGTGSAMIITVEGTNFGVAVYKGSCTDESLTCVAPAPSVGLSTIFDSEQGEDYLIYIFPDSRDGITVTVDEIERPRTYTGIAVSW